MTGVPGSKLDRGTTSHCRWLSLQPGALLSTLCAVQPIVFFAHGVGLAFSLAASAANCALMDLSIASSSTSPVAGTSWDSAGRFLLGWSSTISPSPDRFSRCLRRCFGGQFGPKSTSHVPRRCDGEATDKKFENTCRRRECMTARRQRMEKRRQQRSKDVWNCQPGAGPEQLQKLARLRPSRTCPSSRECQ